VKIRDKNPPKLFSVPLELSKNNNTCEIWLSMGIEGPQGAGDRLVLASEEEEERQAVREDVVAVEAA
jgi:hypothetical protein